MKMETEIDCVWLYLKRGFVICAVAHVKKIWQTSCMVKDWKRIGLAKALHYAVALRLSHFAFSNFYDVIYISAKSI
jgi:hypothetical protein